MGCVAQGSRLWGEMAGTWSDLNPSPASNPWSVLDPSIDPWEAPLPDSPPTSERSRAPGGRRGGVSPFPDRSRARGSGRGYAPDPSARSCAPGGGSPARDRAAKPTVVDRRPLRTELQASRGYDPAARRAAPAALSPPSEAVLPEETKAPLRFGIGTPREGDADQDAPSESWDGLFGDDPAPDGPSDPSDADWPSLEESLRSPTPRRERSQRGPGGPPDPYDGGWAANLGWVDGVNLVEFFGAPMQTFRNFPQRWQRRVYAQHYAALAEQTQAEDATQRDRAHTAMALLPRLLLGAPCRARAGRNGQGRRVKSALVAARLAQLRAGQGAALLAEARKLVARSRKLRRAQLSAGEEAVVRADTALRLVTLDELSRAGSVLSSPGLFELDEATVASCRAKLQQGERGAEAVAPAAPDPAPHLAAAREAISEHAWKALASSPKGSAAGASGARFEFLLGLRQLEDGARAAVEAAWADVVCGRAPEALVSSLRLSVGFAARKTKPGVRPLCAPEPLRRLLCRALLSAEQEEIRAECVDAGQCAAALEGGIETFAKAVRLVLEHHPGWVAYQQDLENAYGCVQREPTLARLEARAPLVARWQRRMWEEPGEVLYHRTDGVTERVKVGQGCEQGDPLGPAACCMAMAPGLRRARARIAELHPKALVLAYMDDVLLVCPPTIAEAALAALGEELGQDGFVFAPDKSWAWAVQRPPSLPPTSKWAPEGLLVAGVPLGTPGFVRDHCESVVARVEAHLGDIRAMVAKGAEAYSRKASALRLLRCANQRLTYLARCVEPELIRPHAQRLDALLQESFEGLFRLGPLAGMPAAAQLTLPEERAGFGFQPIAEGLEADFVGSAELVAPAVQELTGLGFMAEPDTPLELAGLAAAADLELRGLAPMPEWTGERQWSKRVRQALTEKRAESLLDSAEDAGDAVRLQSCSGPGARWLRGRALTGSVGAELDAAATPDPPEHRALLRVLSSRVPDEELEAMVRLRLGLPVGRLDRCARKATDPRSKHRECQCELVGASRARILHALQCPYGGLPRIRHDRVARLLQLLCLEIEGCEVEWLPRPKAIWLNEAGEPSEPDLAVRVPGWPVLYIDVAVVTPGSVDTWEGRKRGSYPVWRERRRRVPGDFSPIVFDYHGAIGDQTLGTLAKLARRSAARLGRSGAAETERWLELLATRVQLECASILLHH